jgi:hypothetical protein
MKRSDADFKTDPWQYSHVKYRETRFFELCQGTKIRATFEKIPGNTMLKATRQE